MHTPLSTPIPPTQADIYGNALSVQDPSSLRAINAFVEGFVCCEARCVEVLEVAHDPNAYVQACCAALHMFGESRQAPGHARPFIERALAHAAMATDRERRFVAAVAAWVQGDLTRAMALHEEQTRLYPRDLVSLKLGLYHLFNQGQSTGMLRLALMALDHSRDVAQMHGMVAFAWEQCHLLRQAEAAAREALMLRNNEPWAQHALAHVMLADGRFEEGRNFLREASVGWVGLNSFMETHNWWHLALFELERGDHDEVLRLYDQQVWGVAKSYSQDQINAVSLLARLELAGGDVGLRWQDLADHLQERAADLVLPFLDLQYLYGLARAGRPQAEVLLHNIEQHAHRANEKWLDTTTWREVCTPAAKGLAAHAMGRWHEAARALGMALPRLLEIGGSHAQRDLFAQIHLDSLMRSGALNAAQNLLQVQLNQYPNSDRLQKQAHRLYRLLQWPDYIGI